MEQLSRDPYVGVLRNLLSEDESANVTQFLKPYLNFPPGTESPKSKSNDWTMKK